MKTVAIVSALAAVTGLVKASPTPTEEQKPNKRATLPTVTASGNAFYAGSERFYVRGIDYQPGGSSGNSDPLADQQVCERDIAEFKKLGVNTIRVYMTDNSMNHDTCMNALAEAGIYAILDVNNPLYSINRDDPAKSYNAEYLQSVFATIDSFVKYPNTLAFFSGNEVINDEVNSTLAAPFVKATTRDMRQYIGDRGYRKVPVGYSAADVSENRMQLAAYMNCGTDDERSDFFAFNDYSWCNTNFEISGWDQKVKNFTGYGIPIFLSEYGCITNGRDFGEIQALMSSNMTGVYSGGLLYEYTYEENHFGIVTVSGSTVQELGDFTKFESALAAYPAPTGNGGASPSSSAIACPTQDSNWLVDSTLLPAMPSGAKGYLQNGAGTGPGLNGPGSQNDGTDDVATASPGSGTVTGTPTGAPTSSSSSDSSATHNAAGPSFSGPIDKAPFIVTGIAVILSLGGALLL